MARRLTLNTAGIKSPLDIGEPPLAPDAAGPLAVERGASPAPRLEARRAGSSEETDVRRFYGGGRPLQTAIALEAAHLARLEQLARASGLSLNAIAVAALHDGLPSTKAQAHHAIVEERVARVGASERRVEYNLRIPALLRARVDELTRDCRQRVPRAERADLVNAALRRSLPRDAQAVSALVAAFTRNLELDRAP
jgi:hypothetical protein